MIYTSNFSNLKNMDMSKCLSISIGTPLWFDGESYDDLKPTWDIVMGHKNGNINDEEYTKIYYDTILSKLNPKEIYEKLDNKILLCWCGKNKFCHRHLIENWLNKFKPNSCAEIK